MQRKKLISLLLVFTLLCGCRDEKSIQIPASATKHQLEFVFSTDFSGENAYLHCRNICALGPRLSGSPAYQQQLDYLEQHLRAAGWKVERDSFTVRGITMTNLRAQKGDSAEVRPVLLSCHVDTKHNIAPDFESADDGASGAAVLLELARILPEDSAQKTELIFLDGEESFAPRMSEEDGLYGSKFDVARRGKDLPHYQINLDMVGGRNKIIAPPALETSDFMYSHYTAAIRELGFSSDRWTIWPGSYMDDHLPYLEAGVDSLNLIAVFIGSDWWHTPRDNMSRICPKSLRESGQMVNTLLLRLKDNSSNQIKSNSSTNPTPSP